MLSLSKNDTNLLEVEVVLESIENQFPFQMITIIQSTDPTNGEFLASLDNPFYSMKIKFMFLLIEVSSRLITNVSLEIDWEYFTSKSCQLALSMSK